MPSATLDLSGSFVIEQNADFLRTFQVNDSEGTAYDLTGAAMAAQIKRPLQRGTPNAAFTVTIFEPETAGAGLLSLTEEQTLQLNTRESYVWDLIMTQADITLRLAEGVVIVTPAVTIAGDIAGSITTDCTMLNFLAAVIGRTGGGPTKLDGLNSDSYATGAHVQFDDEELGIIGYVKRAGVGVEDDPTVIVPDSGSGFWEKRL